jgi:hypothetical protein
MRDREGKLVFESTWKEAFTRTDFKSVETVLEEGERIVGIKSHLKYKDFAWHFSFQFVIGRME